MAALASNLPDPVFAAIEALRVAREVFGDACAKTAPRLPGDEPAIPVQLNAARTAFSTCWFDQEKCAEGLQALRHYRYEVGPDTRQFGKTPLHRTAMPRAPFTRWRSR